MHRSADVTGYTVAFSLYVILALAVMWHAWVGGLTTRTVIPSGDPALIIWTFAYAAKEISHGTLPLTTPLLFHPMGFNLLANPTALGIAVPFVPLTWLFGPIASMNMALTLAPVVSGMAMVYALRRHDAWWPAAVAAGGFWAFSPFELYGLNGGWINTVYLVGPPLVWALLHELLVTRRRQPLLIGVLLAALLVWQFWVSTETFAIICSAGIVVASGVLLVQRAHAGDQRRAFDAHVAKGLVTAAVLIGVLLTVPAWWAIDGSAHLGAWVWPSILISHDVSRLSTYVSGLTTPSGPFFITLTGVVPNIAYVGFGIPLVFVTSLLVPKRNAVLWMLGCLGAVGVLFGLAGSFALSPFQLAFRLPLLHNILPQRWMVIAMFAAAMGIGIGVSEIVRWARMKSSLAAICGIALLAIAVGPVITADAAFAPLPVAAVRVPSWFSTHRGGVLLMAPAPGTVATGLTWEADAGIPTALVGGWGPQDVLNLSKVQDLARYTLWAVTATKTSKAQVSGKKVRAVREAARQWGVTDALVAEPGGVPPFVWGQPPTAAVGLFVEAFGDPTSQGYGWWAWHLTPKSKGLLVTANFSHRCNESAGTDVALVVSCLTGSAAHANSALVRQT